MITGVGCDAEAVKTIASGRMEFSIFMDPRTTAEECENMVDAYLIQEEDSEAEDPEVNDYESYDNGVKIVGAYLCEAQVIDGDNFEILIDNGFILKPRSGRKQRLRRFRQQVPRPRKNRKHSHSHTGGYCDAGSVRRTGGCRDAHTVGRTGGYRHPKTQSQLENGPL